jgi:hypothetical protein
MNGHVLKNSDVLYVCTQKYRKRPPGSRLSEEDSIIFIIPPPTKLRGSELYWNWVVRLFVDAMVYGSRQLSLLPTITISHIWTTHRRKMFPIDF